MWDEVWGCLGLRGRGGEGLGEISEWTLAASPGPGPDERNWGSGPGSCPREEVGGEREWAVERWAQTWGST